MDGCIDELGHSAASCRAFQGNAGWKFSRQQCGWKCMDSEVASKPANLDHPLRLATFNCLHDLSHDDVLQHPIRHDAICQELAGLDADVIGLNEVTPSLLERVLREEWIRSNYTVSLVPDDDRCSHVSTMLSFGNVLLSKIPPSSVEYIPQPSGGRHSHVMSLCVCDPRGGQPHRVAVCSTHLTACPWLMEGRRKMQLEHLTLALLNSTADRDGTVAFDACIIMGDFNFHREAENTSIPEGWGEAPAVVALGETWDFGRNAMLAHYLPVRNIYNGLGLGTSFGWPSPMRLDRVLVHGSAFDCGLATARLFADLPIHERAKGRPPLPQTGKALWDAHRTIPWQEYLFQSDHFGIFVELPLIG
uniref:Endonuclease/exonuclease/phosphatase domain-containing protein n=1 Tax=Haptolina ericina TaxID=156174 RepID=A0A7S3AXD8_9EUKA|mmetsp:Transcript_36967/g.83673  ORF Transcript_36967/g.83673 Transcript_36967/m.83673 type:complete len:361 (+) Transcript_36967:117-1199(+)